MAKIKKKGTSGQAKNYITRTQAVRKLQITLPDFRRLCIFKGIYPREPRNHKKASKSSTQATTFYYAKDIQYLFHEPLLAKFREQKAVSKKIARLLGRNEISDAVRVEKHGTPKITLDHIVRERYPTFVDALRDLDDALSLLFLFTNLPSTSTVPAKVIARCQKLCQEFEHYLIATHSLRKSFLSIKGIHYQATIQGQDIMWLVPYRFVQRTTLDVDYRIMGTFVDFYCTLLGFVNFRLYTTIGLVYPPKFSAESDEKGAELGAFTLEGRDVGGSVESNDEQKAIPNGDVPATNSADVQRHINEIVQLAELEGEKSLGEKVIEEEDNDAIDVFQTVAPEADVLAQPDIDRKQIASLFADTTFYISREAPRHPIEFILRAFGCKRVGWDPVLGDNAFTSDETDARITHQVVDRPWLPGDSSLQMSEDLGQREDSSAKTLPPGMRIPGRTYIQPQWVWDCINEGQLLRPDLYAPGATLPPHLSPWVRVAPGQYDPRVDLAEQEAGSSTQQALKELGQQDQLPDNSSVNESSEEGSVDGTMHVGTSSVSEGSNEMDGEEDGKQDTFIGFDGGEGDDTESDSSEVNGHLQHQSELEAEAAGLPFSSISDAVKSTTGKGDLSAKTEKRAKQSRKEKEELERQMTMMSRKKRKMFEKMQYSNKQRDAEAEKLRSKRRKLEKTHDVAVK